MRWFNQYKVVVPLYQGNRYICLINIINTNFKMTTSDKQEKDGDRNEDSESEADPFSMHGTMSQAISIADDLEDISEIDPDEMGVDGATYKTLQQRKNNLMKTGEILAVHDVVVQKLINKARDDLGM